MVTNRQGTTVETLGSGLTERLEQLGMSRRELARRTGLSRQTIHNIERGISVPKPETMAALDRALKWTRGTAEALVAGKPIPRGRAKTDEQLARIRFRLAHMSPAEIELTLIMLEEHHLGNNSSGLVVA